LPTPCTPSSPSCSGCATACPPHIDDLGGDRAYNWSLNADLGYAQTALHSLSVKTRAVASHAREGLKR